MKKDQASDLIGSIEKFFEKAPALPKNAKDLIVQFTPWIAIIFGILGVLGALGGLGLLTVFSPLAIFGGVEGVKSMGTGFISALFWLGSSVIMIMAYSGLKANKMGGWKMLFWSEIVNVAGSVISLNIIGGAISALIGLYLLFQIKSYYK
jgi:hypothetical protein